MRSTSTMKWIFLGVVFTFSIFSVTAVISLEQSSHSFSENSTHDCSILFIYPTLFSREMDQIGNKTDFRMENQDVWTTSVIAAVLMAVEHINTNNGTVISELSDKGFMGRNISTVYFYEFENNKSGNHMNLRYLQTKRNMKKYDFETKSVEISVLDVNAICGVVGPFQLDSSYKTFANELRNQNIHQISPDTNLLGNKDEVDNMFLDNVPLVVASLVSYFQYIGSEYVAILYHESGNSVFGSELKSYFNKNEVNFVYKELQFNHVVHSSTDISGSLQDTMRELYEIQFNHVVVVAENAQQLETIISEAKALGMLNDNYLWTLICEEILEYTYFRSVPYGGSLDLFANGMGYFQFSTNENTNFSEAFLEAFIDNCHVINKINPSIVNCSDHECAKNVISRSSPIVYDSIVALVYRVNNDGYSDKVTGATGYSLNLTSTSTIANATSFTISNLRKSYVDSSIMQYYEAVLSSIRHSVWASINSFIYSDGTTTLPISLNVHEDMRLPSKAFIHFMVVLSALWIIAYVMSIIFIHVFRNSEVVLLKEAPYFVLLCYGSIFFHGYIILSCLDERFLNLNSLDVVCEIRIWFLLFAITSSYVSMGIKLYQEDTNDSSQRTFGSLVIYPAVCIFAFNIIYIVVMHLINPSHWERVPDEVDEYGRVKISTGVCTFKESGFHNPNLYLGFILLGVMTGTCRYAWKRSLKINAMDETRRIFRANIIQVVAGNVIFCVRIVLKLFFPESKQLSLSTNAKYLLRFLIFSTIGNSTFFFVILPLFKQFLQRPMRAVTINFDHADENVSRLGGCELNEEFESISNAKDETPRRVIDEFLSAEVDEIHGVRESFESFDDIFLSDIEENDFH